MITNQFTDIQKAWLEALKTSVKHRKSLVGPDGQSKCCLGVACSLLPGACIIPPEDPNNDLKYVVKYELRTYDSFLEPTLFQEFGLCSAEGNIKYSRSLFVSPSFIPREKYYKEIISLVNLNDSTNLSHRQIGQILQTYPGLFFNNFDTPNFEILYVSKSNSDKELIFREQNYEKSRNH